jgi:carbamoyltransferase
LRILSISTAHDSSVCLYEDGEVLYFFKEERLSRIKKDGFPILSLNKVLELNDKSIDVVVFCPVFKGDYFDSFNLLIEKYGHDLSKIKFYNLEDDHHLQHASLAFFNSGFEKAAVLVIDRNGSDWFRGARESETIMDASVSDGFRAVYKNFWIYHNFAQEQAYKWATENDVEVDAKSLFGIVKVYESATTLIKQNALENGKVMGLSAYGDKSKNFPELFVNNTNIPNDFYFSHLVFEKDYQSFFVENSQLFKKELSQDNYKDFADFAWQVQKQTQEAVAYLVKKAIDKTGHKKIVLTGGYALNVVANQFLIKSFPEIEFYFEPIADDSGNVLGGAMWAYRDNGGSSKIKPINNLFFHGTNHSLKNVEGSGFSAKDFAEQIADNKAIAIYNGQAEAGPRALGNRSIIFNAMNPDAKKLINVIKKREWYRPFALSVLESDAHKYFDMLGLEKSPHMAISFDALEEAKSLFPGVVHVDGSCRIQTVGKGDGILFEVLEEIKKISGHGVVLNTSFNLAGEPLVETPGDAIRVLEETSLDAIWFPEINKAVFKNEIL